MCVFSLKNKLRDEKSSSASLFLNDKRTTHPFKKINCRKSTEEKETPRSPSPFQSFPGEPWAPGQRPALRPEAGENQPNALWFLADGSSRLGSGEL